RGEKNDSFKLASELKGSEHSQALCDNKMDAFIYMVGNPNGSVKEATTSCDAKLEPAAGPKIDKIVADSPCYAFSTVPGGMYRGTDKVVNGFGVAAAMVTTADVSDEVAYNVAKAVFENVDTFIRLL
ncbi:C4-dicarboxylate ABC transporter substrate-binding protein, partial [Vibrio parahaemolyticus]|uniref:TAXI family TRAP transporter solute-binding subunit n=1 Tax=Vibrio parahaemolyticus TaxID=670 RepID=UPI0005F25217